MVKQIIPFVEYNKKDLRALKWVALRMPSYCIAVSSFFTMLPSLLQQVGLAH